MILHILLYITACSLFIQTLYWGICWIKIISHSPKEAAETHPTSVVVCAHNELENLKRLIPTLLAQNHPEFELIIVNDRSDDGTYDFLLEYNHPQVVPVHVDRVHDHITAKKYAITLGVKAAHHDILLFTDADCEPDTESWIQSMTNDFNPSVEFSLGISQYEKNKGVLNQVIRLETLYAAINYIGFALSGNPYMGVGRNLAYRKSKFLNHKGFNKFQGITGGDDDLTVNQLAHKKNTIVSIHPSGINHSIPKQQWSEWLSQKIRHLSVSKYYKLKDKFLLGTQSLSHSLFWVGLISLALNTDQYLIPASLFLFRSLFMLFMCFNTSKKFGDRINVGLVPVMDFLYVFYVGIIGTKAIFTKNVKWK